MTQKHEAQPDADLAAANNGAAATLSEEAMRNLAGFFDVLIQMDLAQKRKAKEDNNTGDNNGSKLDAS